MNKLILTFLFTIIPFMGYCQESKKLLDRLMFDNGDYNDAITSAMSSLQLAESIDNKQVIANSYKVLYKANKFLGNTEEENKYYRLYN